MKLLSAISVVVLTFWCGTVSLHADDVNKSVPKQYTFSVVPQQAAGKLARTWGPVLAYLSSRTGYKLRFKTAPNIPEFEKRLANGEYDFSYMNPYHYTVFHEQPGYQAMAKALGKQIKGIVVVRKDSDVTDLSQLHGRELAFPAPAAFAASVLPRANFKQLGIDIAPNYVSSHDSVYRAVAKGLYPAGGGVKRTFSTVAPEVRDQLKILWTTQGYTSHAIASHPRVPAQVVADIQAAMEGMANDPMGSRLLKKLAWKGIEKADNELWNDVRALGIDLLDQLVTELAD